MGSTYAHHTNNMIVHLLYVFNTCDILEFEGLTHRSAKRELLCKTCECES